MPPMRITRRALISFGSRAANVSYITLDEILVGAEKGEAVLIAASGRRSLSSACAVTTSQHCQQGVAPMSGQNLPQSDESAEYDPLEGLPIIGSNTAVAASGAKINAHYLVT